MFLTIIEKKNCQYLSRGYNKQQSVSGAKEGKFFSRNWLWWWRHVQGIGSFSPNGRLMWSLANAMNNSVANTCASRLYSSTMQVYIFAPAVTSAVRPKSVVHLARNARTFYVHGCRLTLVLNTSSAFIPVSDPPPMVAAVSYVACNLSRDHCTTSRSYVASGWAIHGPPTKYINTSICVPTLLTPVITWKPLTLYYKTKQNSSNPHNRCTCGR